jgi:hypothetical protein
LFIVDFCEGMLHRGQLVRMILSAIIIQAYARRRLARRKAQDERLRILLGLVALDCYVLFCALYYRNVTHFSSCRFHMWSPFM